MTLANFIPAIWSANLLSNLNKDLVYGQPGVVNTEYEGEIKGAGDRVKINSIGRVTIGNYTKNTNIGDPETLTDSQKTLVIDQQKFFNFQVDDIDKAQQNPKVMGEAMKEAAYGLADVKDTFLAGLHTGADAANLIGNDTTPTSVTTAAQAYDLLVDLGTLLSSQPGITRAGRTVVIPPWFYGLLQKDPRFVTGAKGEDVLRNGQIGQAAGFTVIESLNVPNVAGAKYKIQASVPMARSFAAQIVSTEAYRPQQRFGDAVKGLSVYGAQLVRPTALAVLTANRT
jgi:N4-gp56 family major capsid protein